MQRPYLAFLIPALIAATLAPSPASACSRPARHYSAQEIRRMATEAVASATTIVDGEVVYPMWAGDGLPPDGLLPVAFIKVSHIWKGQVEDNIAPVAQIGSCDLSLQVKGQKVRILLYGTQIFLADQDANGYTAVYQRDAFNREIDRLLGAPRPADFTNPGSLPPEIPPK